MDWPRVLRCGQPYERTAMSTNGARRERITSSSSHRPRWPLSLVTTLCRLRVGSAKDTSCRGLRADTQRGTCFLYRSEMPMHKVLALLVLAVLVAGGAAVPQAAYGASPDLVVSQLFAGGGNAGAPFQNDFVELFNRGSTSVDVSTWTIQYASASGASWQETPLAGSVQPGHYYLVQLASAAAIGSPLPTPDASPATNLAASRGAGALAPRTP